MKIVTLMLSLLFSTNVLSDYRIVFDSGNIKVPEKVQLTEIFEDFDENGATNSNISLSPNMKVVNNSNGGVYINGSSTKYMAFSGQFFVGIEREGTVGSAQRASVIIEVPSNIENYMLSFNFIGDSYENSEGPMSEVRVEGGTISDGVFSRESVILDKSPNVTEWIKYSMGGSYPAIKITLQNGNGSSKNNVSGRFHYIGIDNIKLSKQ